MNTPLQLTNYKTPLLSDLPRVLVVATFLPSMKISMFTGGFVQTNGYLVETTDGNFLIDAPEGVTEWIEQRGVRVDHVLLTHQHYDHVMDAAALKAAGAKLYAFADYSQELTLESPARSWGMPISVPPYQIDQRFVMKEPLKVAGLEISLAHVPGHATDSVTFYLADHGIVFSGDTLFADSIGRTDLPGGSHQQLLDGIAKHLMTLPKETKVFPGHGLSTTIGAEAAGNPYLG
jgi:hydroxyacylglutathione hydrolase